MAKARPSDCTPPRARSSASSSMVGSFDCTSCAIADLRGVSGFSLTFSPVFSFALVLVRAFTLLLSALTLPILFNPYRLASGNRLRRRAVSHHITIAIDVQYYEK